jgi:hypothetical protein
MKVTGADQAQLQIVIPPDAAGTVPTPKPWKLERTKSGQQKALASSQPVARIGM